MKSKFTRVCGSFVLMFMATACGTSNPLQPTTGTTGSTSSRSVSVTVPQSVAAPGDGEQVAYFSQPLTLVIGNAVSTASAVPTYTFEIATDSGFSTIVYTKKGVAQGANGQTSVTIDKLAPSTAYFWRARAVSGGTVGPATAKTFTIGPDIILQKPVLASPAQNGSATGTATLVVNRVDRSGPAGQITYQFDVSSSSSFDRTVFTKKVTENGSQTSIAIPTTTLTPGNTYFWRVQASDSASGVTSDFSDTFSFRYTAFDPTKAIFLDNPPDVGSWAETTAITSIDFTGSAILVDFTKRSGPGRWPEAGFGCCGGVQYTLGMCFNINGQWYCSAAVQFWTDRDLAASGLPSEIARNWYYDSRWGAMQGHQPAQGELVAIWVGQGNLRGSGNTYKERSNFVVLPFGDSYHP